MSSYHHRPVPDADPSADRCRDCGIPVDQHQRWPTGDVVALAIFIALFLSFVLIQVFTP